METELTAELARRGWRGRAVSIERLGDLCDEVERRRTTGDLHETITACLGRHLDFEPPADLPRARSLIIVAVGDPQVRFGFCWNGSQIPLVVPPTYLHARESDGHVAAALAKILEPQGYRVRIAALPKKLLAVRAGLAQYGKNNIAFVPGMGSFVRLSVFYSDMPCEQDHWQDATMMDRCHDCSGCRNICPTGAIPADRFLLRAELCTTYHNEEPVDHEFPDWIEPAWHDCLVGCLHCQRVCPENRKVLGWVEEGGSFSADETRLLLNGTPLDRLPPETAGKIERWDLAQLVELFPRNLRVLLDSAT